MTKAVDRPYEGLTKTGEPMFDTTLAKCAEPSINPDIFMPEGKDYLRATRDAKAVCSGCPLVEQCLKYAIRNDEWGIWGGTTQRERKYLRSRPRQIREYVRVLVESGGRKDVVSIENENQLFV